MFLDISEREDEVQEHKMEVYSKFLEQVNWRIKKLKLVITKSHPAAKCQIDPAILKILVWFKLEELIIDLSELSGKNSFQIN